MVLLYRHCGLEKSLQRLIWLNLMIPSLAALHVNKLLFFILHLIIAFHPNYSSSYFTAFHPFLWSCCSQTKILRSSKYLFGAMCVNSCMQAKNACCQIELEHQQPGFFYLMKLGEAVAIYTGQRREPLRMNTYVHWWPATLACIKLHPQKAALLFLWGGEWSRFIVCSWC